jgi:hypothetical protein
MRENSVVRKYMRATHLDRRRGFLRSNDLFLRSRGRFGACGGGLRVAHRKEEEDRVCKSESGWSG